MAIRVALHHTTQYRYDRPVTLSPHVVRLRPAPHCRTPILSYSLQGRAGRALPQLAAGPVRQLPRAARVSREDRASCRVEVDLVAEMTVDQPVRLLPRAGRREVPVRVRRRGCARSWRRSWRREPAGPQLGELLDASIARHDARRSTSWSDSTSGCSSEIGYVIRLEPGVQTPRGDADARAAARAATRPGCWCRCCATSGSRRASSRAT